MSEHTPGPWEIYFEGDRRHIVQSGSLKFPSAALTQANWIAEIDPEGTGHDIEETNSNARLIAAAPDLLAAAQRVVESATIMDGAGIAYADDFALRALTYAIALATKGDE